MRHHLREDGGEFTNCEEMWNEECELTSDWDSSVIQWLERDPVRKAVRPNGSEWVRKEVTEGYSVIDFLG